MHVLTFKVTFFCYIKVMFRERSKKTHTQTQSHMM